MKKFLLFCALLLVYLAVDIYISNNMLERERIELVKESLPEAFQDFTIVQISDTHAKRFGENNEKLFQMVREEAPDIIVLTGDIVERLTELAYAEELFLGLQRIAPAYYVTGNHEWGADWVALRRGEKRFTPELFALMERCGVVKLDNTAVPLVRDGQMIWLAGLCDPNGPADSKSIGKVLAKTDGAFSVLLSHRYDMYEEYISGGADVVFCGHAHGGLVRLPFTDGLIGPSRQFFPERTSGLYEENGVSVIVSRGLSGSGFPRMWNRPHVVSVKLVNKFGS